MIMNKSQRKTKSIERYLGILAIFLFGVAILADGLDFGFFKIEKSILLGILVIGVSLLLAASEHLKADDKK